MIRHLPLTDEQQKTVRLLYRASGIRYRYSVISDFAADAQDFSFFPPNAALEPFPPVSRRMALYQQEAIGLAEKASRECLGTEGTGVTHLITVSCTGMYAPGIDIELIRRLRLPTDTQRTSINFMGCYAAFNALKVADQIVRNDPDASVLVVAVELCSIHLLKTTDENSLLSNALFGDGAAAVLVQGRPNGRQQLELTAFYSDLALDAGDEMAWHISDFGFVMKLTAGVPEAIRRGIAGLTSRLLQHLSLTVAEVEHFAIHPGGKKILEVIGEELNIPKERMVQAFEVLRDYGNMSSPTVLFVLKKLWDGFERSNKDERILSFAFGPGLTLESMCLTIR